MSIPDKRINMREREEIMKMSLFSLSISVYPRDVQVSHTVNTHTESFSKQQGRGAGKTGSKLF
jgi:hypothetical protein